MAVSINLVAHCAGLSTFIANLTELRITEETTSEDVCEGASRRVN